MNDIFQSTLIEMGRTPDIWDLQEDGTKYLGFCRTGTRSEEDSSFMIVKIEPISETVSRRLYAEGIVEPKDLVHVKRDGQDYMTSAKSLFPVKKKIPNLEGVIGNR